MSGTTVKKIVPFEPAFVIFEDEDEVGTKTSRTEWIGLVPRPLATGQMEVAFIKLSLEGNDLRVEDLSPGESEAIKNHMAKMAASAPRIIQPGPGAVHMPPVR